MVLRTLALVLIVLLTTAPGITLASRQNPSPTQGNGRSRETPFALGEIGQVGDYTLKVLSVTPDATSIVMQENQFNDPPAPGNVFFMIRVEVTYRGVGTGTPGFDLDFSVVGDQNRGYSDSEFDCGVIPDSGYDAPELFTDGTAEFNICWSVPADEANSLVMYVESDFSDERVWFSLNETISTNTNTVPSAPTARSLPRLPPAKTSPTSPVPTAATSEAPAIQGSIMVGQTEVGWTGDWQYDASSSMEQQATLTQIDAANGTIKLATYGEFQDTTVNSAETALDTFAISFFDGAGAQGVGAKGSGLLPDGTIWKVYTFNLQGLQLTFLATVSEAADGSYVVSTLTGNTDQFPATIGQAQQEILLNGQPVFLAGIDAEEIASLT